MDRKLVNRPGGAQLAHFGGLVAVGLWPAVAWTATGNAADRKLLGALGSLFTCQCTDPAVAEMMAAEINRRQGVEP